MMEPDPAAFALLEIILEGRLGRVTPSVGGIIELDEHLVLGQECRAEWVRVLEHIHREVILRRGGFEPFHRGHDEGRMLIASFRQNQGFEPVRGRLRRSRQRR